MMLSKEDIEALEDAKEALETSVRVSMLARKLIVERLDEALKASSTEDDPESTFGAPEPGEAAQEACHHIRTKEIPSMGDTVTSICYDCNATLKDGVAEDA